MSEVTPISEKIKVVVPKFEGGSLVMLKNVSRDTGGTGPSGVITGLHPCDGSTPQLYEILMLVNGDLKALTVPEYTLVGVGAAS